KELDPALVEMEKNLADSLGTRVHIEKRENGGKVTIDFFSNDDLQTIMEMLKNGKLNGRGDIIGQINSEMKANETVAESAVLTENVPENGNQIVNENPAEEVAVDDRSKEEKEAEDNSEDLYSIKNFSL
ncbi:MAG: hypothetical protein Q7R78_01070, partial [bacterium]|nr:hypothetical protein [bacterium]